MVEKSLEELGRDLEDKFLPQLKFYMDFPKKGVNFLDIFSITSNPVIFKAIMDGLEKLIIEKIGKPGEAFTHLIGLESKGFVIGPILCLKWGIPFVPIRKKGKLPGECWE